MLAIQVRRCGFIRSVVTLLVVLTGVAPLAWGQEAAPQAAGNIATFRSDVARLERFLKQENRNYPSLWAVEKVAQSFDKLSPEDVQFLSQTLLTAKPPSERERRIDAELAAFIVMRALPPKDAQVLAQRLLDENPNSYTSGLAVVLLDNDACVRTYLATIEKLPLEQRSYWYTRVTLSIAIGGDQADLAALNKLMGDLRIKQFDLIPALKYRASLSQVDRVLLEEQESLLLIQWSSRLWTAGHILPRCFFASDHAYFLCQHHKFAPHLLRDRLHDTLTVWILFYQEGKGCRPTIEKLLRELEAGTFKRKSPFGEEGCELAQNCRLILKYLDEGRHPFDDR